MLRPNTGATAEPPRSPRSPAALATRLFELTAELSETITLDGLTRDFKIFQRRRGHRHSTDDFLTAWYAATHPPAVLASTLDLGTGVGSVALSVAWRFPAVTVTAIEVQAISFRFLRENVWANGLEARFHTIHGDLRQALPPATYDLVTGSPPYFDVSTGIVSPDPQRASARFELHGDIGDYCRAAAGALAPGGRFVFCFPTAQRERALRGCKAAHLFILSLRDVVPKEGLAPLFSLFVCALRPPESPGGRSDPVTEKPLVVRDSKGVHTPEMTAARAVFGMPASDETSPQ